MTVNMEVKKDGLRQTQDGIWKLSLTVHPNDMPIDLMTAPMGSRYALAMIPISDEQGANNAQSNHSESFNSSEGEKLRTRAIMLCKDASFQEFVARTQINLTYTWMGASIDEVGARNAILEYCNIKSRSELATNEDAQRLFYELDSKYKDWIFEQQHADSLERL